MSKEDLRYRAVAVTLHDSKLLVIKRFFEGKNYYVLPGGGVESDETIEEAVVREVMEECCIEVKLLHQLYQHDYQNQQRQFYYLCEYVKGTPKLGEGINEVDESSETNVFEPMWLDIQKLKDSILYPIEIRDLIIEDLKTSFEHDVIVQKLNISELRKE